MVFASSLAVLYGRQEGNAASTTPTPPLSYPVGKVTYPVGRWTNPESGWTSRRGKLSSLGLNRTRGAPFWSRVY